MEAVKYLREAAEAALAYSRGNFGGARIEITPWGVVVTARRGPKTYNRLVPYDVLASANINPLTHALAEVAETVGLQKQAQEEPS